MLSGSEMRGQGKDVAKHHATGIYCSPLDDKVQSQPARIFTPMLYYTEVNRVRILFHEPINFETRRQDSSAWCRTRIERCHDGPEHECRSLDDACLGGFAGVCLYTQERAVCVRRCLYYHALCTAHGPGVRTKVEPERAAGGGFSSPLHMLLLAVLGMARIPLFVAARVVGFVSHAALMLFLWRFIARREGGVATALVSALVIASWPILVWDLGDWSLRCSQRRWRLGRS